MGSCNPTQGPRFSQVSLPCDSQGTVDFSNYPLRVSLPSTTLQNKAKRNDRFVSYFYLYHLQ